MSYNKYRNKKVIVDNIKFDSIKESRRYIQLKLLEQASEISELQLQVPFEVIPKQKDERKCVYKVDFVYKENGKLIAEDVKGKRTKEYIIKRKLFKLKYPEYEFKEITEV